jgi:hypothetical protein
MTNPPATPMFSASYCSRRVARRNPPALNFAVCVLGSSPDTARSTRSSHGRRVKVKKSVPRISGEV